MIKPVKSKKEKPEETVDKPREVFNLFDKVQDISKETGKLDTLYQFSFLMDIVTSIFYQRCSFSSKFSVLKNLDQRIR